MSLHDDPDNFVTLPFWPPHYLGDPEDCFRLGSAVWKNLTHLILMLNLENLEMNSPVIVSS